MSVYRGKGEPRKTAPAGKSKPKPSSKPLLKSKPATTASGPRRRTKWGKWPAGPKEGGAYSKQQYQRLADATAELAARDTRPRLNLGTGGRVVLPPDLLEVMGLAPGDDFFYVLTPAGTLELVPVKLTNKDQAYFWGREVQAGLAETELDRANGYVRPSFSTVEEIRAFHEALKALGPDEDL